jgi:hypothetical protein
LGTKFSRTAVSSKRGVGGAPVAPAATAATVNVVLDEQRAGRGRLLAGRDASEVGGLVGADLPDLEPQRLAHLVRGRGVGIMR